MIDTLLTEFEDYLSEKNTEKKLIESNIKKLKGERRELKVRTEDLQEARDIVVAVGVMAQEEVKHVVEGLVTKTIQPIWGDEYRFEMENKVNRKMPETHLFVVKRGIRFPVREDNSGLGLKDVVSFALRVVSWVLSSPRPRPVFILDEPGKYISPDKMVLFGEMIFELSKSFGLQFLVVTHEHRDEFIAMSSRAYVVTQRKGISSVEEITNAISN